MVKSKKIDMVDYFHDRHYHALMNKEEHDLQDWIQPATINDLEDGEEDEELEYSEEDDDEELDDDEKEVKDFVDEDDEEE